MEGVEKQEVQVSAVPADVKSRIEETQAACVLSFLLSSPNIPPPTFDYPLRVVASTNACPSDIAFRPAARSASLLPRPPPRRTSRPSLKPPPFLPSTPPSLLASPLSLSPRTARFSLPAGVFLSSLSSEKCQIYAFSSLSLDKDLIVFSRATGKNIAKLKGHAKKVTAVLSSTSLTSDDVPSFLVSSSVDKTVRVWTPNGSKQVYGASSTISLDGEATGLALHPSNTLAAASSSDGTWSLIDLNGDKASVVLSGGLPEGVTTALTSVAFHPDGALFALGSSEGKIYIFDILAGGKCAITLSSESATGAVTSISFSENGYILASSTSGSQAVSIWDLRKGVSTHTIALEGADESATVSTVAFDYSNQFLAVVGSDARIYQFKTWELLAKSDENAAELTGVAWGKDSREVVVVGLDRTARVLAAPSSDE